MAEKSKKKTMLNTSEDLKALQNLPLEMKIELTKDRIREFSEYFDNKIYVSFSGGKDSTVLLDIVRSVYPDTLAVYCDTGLEYPEIKEFVKSTPNVQTIRPEMSFRQVIEKYGYPVISKEVSQKISEARATPNGVAAERFEPGNKWETEYHGIYSMTKWAKLKDSDIPVSNECCNIMKKKPFKQFEKETGLHPIIATTAEESKIRKQRWLEVGCNSFTGERPMSTPLSFWTEQDVLAYIRWKWLPICSVYGKVLQWWDDKFYMSGVARTGCVFCMFGCHLEKKPNRFQKLKKTHHKLWEYCMKPWEDGGLGLSRVLDFIGVAYA